MSLQKYMAEKKVLIEDRLKKYLGDDCNTPVVYDAMAYSLFAGGKRLRPILAIMSCELFGGSADEITSFACSIELIHTYSLIHDDLPAMDNDDFRRGKPTNHKIYGDGFAILAGDALLNKAYEILFDTILSNKKPEYIRAAREIAQAAGVTGMIGGQAMDLFYENKEITLDRLGEIHDRKTGALLKVSLTTGALVAGAKEEDIRNIDEFGYLIGRAFQITDDVLDVKGSKGKLGKSIGKDKDSDKATYVKYYGADKSMEIASSMIGKAKEIISIYEDRGKLLKQLADYIINREF